MTQLGLPGGYAVPWVGDLEAQGWMWAFAWTQAEVPVAAAGVMRGKPLRHS